jgi:D-glycero-alpha-D-manno-heptose-7-phosphate kinase
MEYLAAKNLLDISDASKQIILNGDLQDLGELLHESWECKKKLSLGISNPYIDHIYDKGMKNGALGAKLLGAGGGGFMLFYCPVDRQMELRHSMQGLKELKVELDLDGVSIIHNE